jgi:pyrroline-5-carboxylate reductase
MQPTQARIGFIGGGNMAQAIIRGLLAAGHLPDCILVADPAAAQRTALQQLHTELVATADNAAVAGNTDLLVLAVKPQAMAAAVQTLAAVPRPPAQIVMSIAAGITLASLRSWHAADTALVRVMPNTPALVGAGMAALYADTDVDAAGRTLAEYAMAATGKALWVESEALLDAVTAVSGSGPAYFFLIMEILQDVGEELGLSPTAARLLATQTAAGAGLLATQSTTPPGTLRERVTSPGGTTAAALAALESGGIRAIFRTALLAARDRSVELGQADDTT